MRLISFESEAGSSWGAVVGDGVVDLAERLGVATLRSALEGHLLSKIGTILAGSPPRVDHALADIRFEPVIPDPGQILCVGLNYSEHQAETLRERTDHPTIFARFGRSQIGHDATIVRPRESSALDFEGELAIIIGRQGRRINEVDAMSYIAGYACYNDVTLRDFQKHTSQWHPGKNFPATGAFGPWMVTSDEIPDPTVLSIQTRLNGEVVQAAGLSQLIFSIPEIIAYCSTFTDLRPGDVIATGTPGGVGSARKPPLWMTAGDRVEVEIPLVGCLANSVADEDTPTQVAQAAFAAD